MVVCGICGAVVIRGSKSQHELALRVRTMLAAMRHRGPDGEAFVAHPGLAMGVNRLAIRKTQAGRPPLVEGTPNVLLACNGEIDNHRELRRSLLAAGQPVPAGSDVAVLAPLYRERGLAFVDAVRGVFALALWDATQRRLVLARDRAGERHLHYFVADGVAYFASELGALLTVPAAQRGLDRSALRRYLLRGYCPAPRDAAAGCRKVRPGEIVVIDATGVHGTPFWAPPVRRVHGMKPSRQTFDDLFRDAVRSQTDVDVGYGVLLSGGLDSALITAVARSVRPERPLTAYCARFAEASFDEGAYAASVAGLLGCRFVSVEVSPASVPGVLRHLVASTGELLADPAWIPHAMVARRASMDVPMLLGGEGADELFGGYPTHLGARLAARYMRLPRVVRAGVRRYAARLHATDRNMTLGFLLQRFVQGEGLDGLARHRLWTASIAPHLVADLGNGLLLPDAAGTLDGPVLDAVQRFDFTQSLPEALLAKADRGGMCHGVEVRAPFLDAAVVAFAAALPVRERVHGLTTKVFLKRYAARYLPDWVIRRRKRGLSVPLGAWLRGPLHDWARMCLARGALQDVGIDRTAALRLLAAHCRREHDHARAIWTLIVLSEWLEWRADLQAEAPREACTARSASLQMRA